VRNYVAGTCLPLRRDSRTRLKKLKIKRYNFDIVPQFDTPDFRQLLHDLIREQQPSPHSLKQDIVTSVWRIEVPHQTGTHSLIVKRYNTQNLWHTIRRSFRQSRAENCWKLTQLFDDSGLRVAPRVAVIQEWWGPFKQRSWFVNQYMSSVDLLGYLIDPLSPGREASRLSELVSEMSDIFKRLKQHRLSHGDMKATNILLCNGNLFLIDLDAAQQHRYGFTLKRARRKDRRRFMKNWRDQPEIYAAFDIIDRPQEHGTHALADP